jgi:hypothetical protein
LYIKSNGNIFKFVYLILWKIVFLGGGHEDEYTHTTHAQHTQHREREIEREQER